MFCFCLEIISIERKLWNATLERETDFFEETSSFGKSFLWELQPNVVWRQLWFHETFLLETGEDFANFTIVWFFIVITCDTKQKEIKTMGFSILPCALLSFPLFVEDNVQLHIQMITKRCENEHHCCLWNIQRCDDLHVHWSSNIIPSCFSQTPYLIT